MARFSGPAPFKHHRCAAVVGCRYVLLGIMLVIVLVAGELETMRAHQGTPEAPVAQKPEPQVRSLSQVDSHAARALVERHRPILLVRQRDGMCAGTGEPYLPVPVDLVLGNPEVRLRENSGRRDFLDPVLVQAPKVEDLASAGADTYLDFPGDPRNPGCTYERWYRAYMADHDPTAYARVVEVSETWVVIQYHVFYVLNNFTNRHEGDWEMIQVLYEAPDAMTALIRQPMEVAYAQHDGGETAAWDSGKLERVGSRPVVYVSEGSHASHYRSNIWLGWGTERSGFGCDTTQGPHHEVEYVVERLPMPSVDPEDPMGWLNWRGRWGERQAWQFDGPVGPRRTRRWTDPVGWHEQLRDSSVAVPGARVFGPAPADVFCSATRHGASVLMRFIGAPWYFLTMLLVPVIAVVGLLWLAWSTFVSTLRLYLRYLPAFTVLGLVIILIGIVAGGTYDLAIRYSGIRTLVELMEFTPVSYYVSALPIGSLQLLAGLLVVVPAVMELYRSIERGEPITPGTVLRGMRVHFRPMLRALARPVGKIVLAHLTVIGLPWAIERAVRWSFVVPAVLLDDTPPDEAPARSAMAVKGRWWRTAAALLVVTMLGTMPGPLLGIVLLVTESRAIDEINAWSSAIYAVTLPFAILGTAVLYRQNLGQQLPQLAQIPLGEHVPGGKKSLGSAAG